MLHIIYTAAFAVLTLSGWLYTYLVMLKHEKSPISFIKEWYIQSKYFGNIYIETWLGFGCYFCFATFWSLVFCLVFSLANMVLLDIPVIALLPVPPICGILVNHLSNKHNG